MDVDIRTATPDDLAWTAAIGVSGLILLLFVIFRFGRDSMLTGSSVTYVAQTKDQQHMVKVENPFSITVENRGNASLSDGIDLVVSSTCQFKMRCYWGLNCSAYHRCNELRWIDLFEGGVDGTLWSQHTLEQGELFQSDSCEGLRFRAVPCAPIESSKLGNSPRQRLPLVVVMMRDGVSSNCEDTQVVALLSAVHIADDVCKMDTGIVTQYMKQASGRTCALQPLYVPMEEAVGNQDARSSNEPSNPEPLCVVCQASSATHALLPCRHTCVCGACFSKLDACPMCRRRIISFFMVGEESRTEPDSSADAVDEAPRPWRDMGWGQRLWRLNDRLNAWVGMY
ncbi:cell growth regulator with RING finger domain protein 1 [Ixodes scapularis]|nr:cell growth regulator with RING finger domain protein 1 [Ixodes scapularis]